ncbi:MAG: hypothetical protein WD738_06985 [Pirellulales bacterium]
MLRVVYDTSSRSDTSPGVHAWETCPYALINEAGSRALSLPWLEPPWDL